jgi:hypothetical protein
MSVDPSTAQPPQRPGRLARVEYLDFQSVADYREYRLAIHGPDGSSEVRLRIANSSFDTGRARLQDGPEICYRRLLRAVACGETAPDVVTIDDLELASYREAHTQVPRHRPWAATLPPRPAPVQRTPLRPRPPQPPIAAPAASPAKQGPAEGQRVSHAAFGVGVVTASRSGHTTVHFDECGPRTFITSMLDLELLSAPHTWETGPRGKNRPRETAIAS